MQSEKRKPIEIINSMLMNKATQIAHNVGDVKAKRIARIELSSYDERGTYQTASITTKPDLFYPRVMVLCFINHIIKLKIRIK